MPLLGCGVMVTQQILVLLFMVRVRATQLKGVPMKDSFFVWLIRPLGLLRVLAHWAYWSKIGLNVWATSEHSPITSLYSYFLTMLPRGVLSGV